ncbi:putative uncharacterized protein [Prevotella sp. CAG:924]|nr:putative uncharacterized protein [Prevotella sp. CAG:924]
MDKNKIEEGLLNTRVMFLPWIGDNYELGIAFDNDKILGTKEKPGKKILVLGESHYIDDFDPEEPKNHQFTKEVISDYLKGREGSLNYQRWMNTFLKFERAVYGKVTSSQDSQEIWNHLAFYNFLQTPLCMARMQPDDTNFEKSEEPFFKVLDLLRPDVILVWGKRLYSKLPIGSDSVTGKEGEGVYVDGYRADSWVYSKNDGYKSIAISLYHPSVGFDWSFWNSIIKNGVTNGR